MKKSWYFFYFKVKSGSVFPQNGSEDLDPYQNETDPKHPDPDMDPQPSSSA